MSELKVFNEQLDHPRIEAAIAAAEMKTSGEIRVVLQAGPVEDATASAAQEFAHLKMHRTAERNAVLFFVAPEARKFAVYGDEGIHQKCPPNFWTEVAAAMEKHFRADDPTTALVEGITRAGNLLVAEFPRQSDDVDELSNKVVNRPAAD
ncbi:TPM domain-containing protein [Synoicihabitans lomoniglobus]|uniref:TPM domain-containing protein n=1 Tax=Synoicihabitans lomoniglobus TaxID=2909285 RepID=A0AAE9ZWG0_9BACT|nr:TPM domain-containing protein [Opitutaceae bacterium LMO-M01]WED64449.1 TPM domain-containing protein [Opitutaceae bacterium LMO-M01]